MVLTCNCGAKVRVPDEGTAAQYRCPKCRQSIAVPVTAGASSSIHSSPIVDATVLGTCPICQTSIRSDEAGKTCPSCGQLHHAECWNEVGGCAIYGCKSAPAVAKPAPEGPA